MIEAKAFTVETLHTRYRFLAKSPLAIDIEADLRRAFGSQDGLGVFELKDNPDVAGIPFAAKGHAITSIAIRRVLLRVRDTTVPLGQMPFVRGQVWDDE